MPLANLNAINVGNAAGAGVHQDPEVVAVTTALICKSGTATLYRADAAESAIADNCATLTAAEARADQTVAEPVLLRIPEPAKAEAEPVIFVPAPLMAIGIVLPVRLGTFPFDLNARS